MSLHRWFGTLSRCLLVLAAMVGVAWTASPRLWANDDLPEEFVKVMKDIEARAKDLESRAPRLFPERVQTNSGEIRKQLDELAIEAEFEDDHTYLVRVRKILDSALEKSNAAAKGRQTKADDLKKRAAKAEGGGMMDGMDNLAVEVPVDMKNVSFKKDVAPIIAGACGRCHNATMKSGDFNAMNFNSFMSMVAPGKPGNSHVLDLVTGKAEPKMPRGAMSVFPQQWADIWTAWIEQGAKFDGPQDKKGAMLTEYMIDYKTQKKMMYAKMPAAEVEKLHRAEVDRLIKVVSPKTPPNFYGKGVNAFVYTTTAKGDEEYVGTLVDAVIDELKPRFGLSKGEPMWKGKIGFFVFSDRTDYIAFAREVDEYLPGDTVFGHFRNEPEMQYVAMTTEVKGFSSVDGPVAQMAATAFLMSLENGRLPDWAVYGFSRAESKPFDSKSKAFLEEQAEAKRIASNGRGLLPVFEQKAAWIEAAPLSASFFSYLGRNEKKTSVEFLKNFAKTGNLRQSATQAFQKTPEQLNSEWQSWAAASRAGL